MRHIIIMVLLSSSILQAQPEFRIVNQYTRREGLSNTAVYDIYQDSRGFLWIATKEGLNRFDGLHFKSYYHNKYDPGSLPHNTVNDILEYQPGLLLIATANGLAVYNSMLGAFENDRITHTALRAGSGANIGSMHLAPDGMIWLNADGELDILDQDLNYQYRFTDLSWAKPLKGITIKYENWSIDAKGRWWLPSDTSGIQIIDFQNKMIYNGQHNPDQMPYLEFKHIRSLMIDQQNDILYVGPWGSGLYRYDLNTGQVLHQDFGQPVQESSSVNAIILLDNGQLLCSSNGNFFEADPGTLAFRPARFREEIVTSGKHNLVTPITIFRSNENLYWIGANEGLFQLEKNNDYRELNVSGITGQSECMDVMVSKHGPVYSLYENGYLIETDSAKRNFTAYKLPVPEDAIMVQLCEDLQDQLWIATSAGVVIFHTQSKSFLSPRNSLAALRNAFINIIYRDQRGDIWIGTRQPFALYTYQYTKDVLRKIQDDAILSLEKTGPYARISGIKQDEKGNIWLRSVAAGGLIRFDIKSRTWQQYPESDTTAHLLVNKGIYDFHPDKAGHLWLTTTVGDGLIRYDYSSHQTLQFNREDGLLSDYIFSMEAYGDYLFLATEYGYTRFHTTDHTMVSKEWKHNSSSFEMAMDPISKDIILGDKGKIWFMPIEETNETLTIPRPEVDRFSINNQPQFIDLKNSTLRLAHHQKNISIDFTAPWYSDAARISFAYFLEGADQEWQYAGTSRTAQYATLAPGTYVFKLKAANTQGQWSEEVTAVTFIIVPPFWQSPWFIMSFVAAVIAAVYYGARRRLETIRNESSLRQKIAETEMMALRAQMNPHFIFNSLNSIDALIHSDDKYQATIYLNKFARLIRNVLDSSKHNLISVEKDMETLKLYIELEQFRSENAFTSDIHVDPAIYREDLRVPPLIIQPYVENAILHGLRNRADGKGHLRITLKKGSDGIVYTIEDNGVGRKFTMNGRRPEKISYGMQMSRDRIRLFNQEEHASVHITDLFENEIPSGTRVEVQLKTEQVT